LIGPDDSSPSTVTLRRDEREVRDDCSPSEDELLTLRVGSSERLSRDEERLSERLSRDERSSLDEASAGALFDRRRRSSFSGARSERLGLERFEDPLREERFGAIRVVSQ
jgi:hypothetical protein